MRSTRWANAASEVPARAAAGHRSCTGALVGCPVLLLHQDLLALRRSDAAFRAQRPHGVDGVVLGPKAFVLRYFTEEPPSARAADRLLLVNLGTDLYLRHAPEPLLAPPEHHGWEVLWSSEAPRYGGCGTPQIEGEEGWRLPGHAAVVLRPVPQSREGRPPGAVQGAP